MESIRLAALAEELLAEAREHSSGRTARTVHGGHEHSLRQTVIAIAGGRALGEHESPGEASLQVLDGRVRLIAGEQHWEGVAGDYLIIPPARHDLEALSDTVVLLTVVVDR
ncbi:cupin domain-containing protein [Cumulibacter manganitolerans]|uniref:cupin domain-containing protein n=1 Tax=Cumulibacter manganitolerans TaxID=1884992 RepID=UPI0012952F2E|nr:cupin domain-containing protein [Cumulibacter manganitolerans]